MSRFAAILRNALWFGLAAIIVLSPTQYGVEVAKRTYVSIADPLIWGVFGVWLLNTLRLRPLPRLRYPPFMVWLFILVASLSAIRAVHPSKSAKDILQVVEYFVAAYMLFANVPERAQVRKMVNLLLAAASVVIVVGLVQYVLPGTPDFAVRATFGNRNVMGGYVAMIVPFMAGLALYEDTWWRRAWLLSAATAALLITLSGGAVLAVALATAVLAMLRGRAAFVAFAAAFCVMLVLVLPRLPRHNDAVLNDSWRLFNDSNEVALRYSEWQAAMVMTAENPWLGVGIGNYQDNIGGYFGVLPRPTGVVEHDSENLYLVIASSTGLPGLACFLGVLLTFGTRAARRFFSAGDRRAKGMAVGLLGAILGFTICSIWSPLLVRGIGVQLALLFALTDLLETRDEVSEQPGARH